MEANILISLFFTVVTTVSMLDACNETDPSLVITQCCRNGRDGRDGLTIMGPRGPQGCKGETGKNGKDGKQGPQGPQGPAGKCDDAKLNLIIKEIQMKKNLRNSLVGYWTMDEESGNYLDDDSGHENHGTVPDGKPIVKRGKYSRGRYFDSNGHIVVPNGSSINFGTKSFSFTGWVKIEDYTYPLTNIAVEKGGLCWPTVGTPGWDIGHQFKNGYTQVCIRDHHQNFVRTFIKHDASDHTSNLLGKWTHYAVVFDRMNNKIKLYINAKKQQDEKDISKITGSVDNHEHLSFGLLQGWKMKGSIDEYRLYNDALDSNQISMIYQDKYL